MLLHRPLIFFILGSSRSVSYTHLDVYKRQVPRRDDGVAPPVAALVVVHVPGDDRVVGVARVVVLGVDLDAVAVWIAQVEVERVRDAVAARPALDAVRLAQRAELVADRENVVLLVRREAHVVHALSLIHI